MKGPDYILDIHGLATSSTGASAAANGAANNAAKTGEHTSANNPKPWLAVHWRCCHVYNRIYRNAEGNAYQGFCPTCGRPVRVGIGEGGTSSRFFEAH
ncbi:MAG: hypothetical protein IT443_08245 [Phycisphaeraceae bacterium]|nr:hypothetical protein [Phycisphaeraceae bacterium]